MIVNCYSLVNVSNGNAIGWGTSELGIKNSFYLRGTAKFAAGNKNEWNGVTEKDETYMKSQAFVDALNNGGDVWTRDDDINEGYPILKNIKYRK